MSAWTLIQNPKASSGKYEDEVGTIRSLLEQNSVQIREILKTAAPRHAIELTQTAIRNGARRLLALGGDGTLNEVANGILKQQLVDSPEITLAQLPTGTGNDWGRALGLPKKLEEVARVIAEGRTLLQERAAS